MLRVGMLTSGGDCQALNAAMRGVAKSFLTSAVKLRYMDLRMVIKVLFMVNTGC